MLIGSDESTVRLTKLDALTVCVGFADFLSVTLPWNLPLFDRFIVVTSPEDHATRELCRRYGVHVILTEEFKRGGPFNKARAINKGIDSLSCADWVLHLDADIVLPQMFRAALLMAHLDHKCIYGCDRVMVRSWAEWEKLLATGYLDHQQHDFHCRVNFPRGYDVGSRWASNTHGYVPIGFFQLWHGDSDLYRGIHLRHYPPEHSDAARTDVQFALQWDRRHRVLLPEVIAVHLESEYAELGANWKGRTTKPFKKR